MFISIIQNSKDVNIYLLLVYIFFKDDKITLEIYITYANIGTQLSFLFFKHVDRGS